MNRARKNVPLLQDNLWKDHCTSQTLPSLVKIKQRRMQATKQNKTKQNPPKDHIENQGWHGHLKGDIDGLGLNAFLNSEENNSGVKLLALACI